jgi:hypothetical protein
VRSSRTTAFVPIPAAPLFIKPAFFCLFLEYFLSPLLHQGIQLQSQILLLGTYPRVANFHFTLKKSLVS